MSQWWTAFACSLASVACAPAELSGSDRADSGVADKPDAHDAGREGAVDTCRDPATASDFYVVRDGGAGACTFTTLSAALRAAKLSTADPRTVHLETDTYSAPTTKFPIDLRGGISLEGNGAGASVLVGTGLADIAPPRNARGPLSASPEVNATILVGDPVKTSRIEALSIMPTAPEPSGSEGIVCDRGNAATLLPSPNTLVSHVAIEGFELGIRVTWSPSSRAGCNLSLTSSLVSDGWYGVVADGKDGPSGPVQTVSARIGDLTPGGGNNFLNFDIYPGPSSMPFLELNGAGVMAGDAVTGVVVEGNSFYAQSGSLSDWGILAVHSGSFEQPGFDIEGNDFGPLIRGGIWLSGAVLVDRLLDNTFHQNGMVTGDPFPGVGIAIEGDATDAGSPVAVVRRARGNSFVGNDVGVALSAQYGLRRQDPDRVTDFGNAGDPGKNTFRCNSVPAQFADASVGGEGADVLVTFPVTQPPSVTVPFEGNTWDHAPPTAIVAPWASAKAGTDVDYSRDPDAGPAGPVLDTANARPMNMPPCTLGRVAGP
jgi:hypothetical protein